MVWELGQGHGKVVDRGSRRLKTCDYISEKPANAGCRRRSLACAGQHSPSVNDFAVALVSRSRKMPFATEKTRARDNVKIDASGPS